MLLTTAIAAAIQAGAPYPAPADILSQNEIIAGEIHDIDVIGGQGEPITFHVEIEGDLRTFMVEPQSIRANGYRLIAQLEDGTLQDMQPGPISTYRGFSTDNLYKVWAGFDGIHLTATIESLVTGGGYEILPLPTLLDPVYDHLVYRVEADIAEKGTCELIDPFIDDSEQLPGTLAFGGGTTPLKVAQLAIDCDFEFYQSNGSSISNTEADVETVINRVINDHYNDTSQTNDPEITYLITAIVVRTTSNDPYSSNSAGTMLNELGGQWQGGGFPGIPRDHVELFSDKNISGGTIGVAWLSGICSNLEYSVVESKIGSLTSRASLTSHEIGHNWGSGHCSGGDCHIMCPSLGGCAGLGGDFGASALSQINSGKAAHLFCLDDPGPTGGPTAPNITAVGPGTIAAVVVDGATLTLTGSGFTGTTSVTIDGVPLEIFPAEFNVVDDGTLVMQVAPQTTLGTKVIEVTNALGSDTAQFAVSFNLAPTLELIGSDPGFQLSAVGADILVGSLPNDIVYLLASVSNQPSVLPGLVSLGIGNNFLKLIDLGVTTVSPASGYTRRLIPLAGVPVGTQFFVQAAVISSVLSVLPAVETNVQSGTVLF